MPDVRIDVYADTHGAPDALNKTKQALDDVGTSGGTTGGVLDGLWKQFAAGQLAAQALEKGLSLVYGVIKGGIGQAIEDEQAQVKLNSALAASGRTVSAMLDPLLQFALHEQEVTTFTHSQVEASEALLVSMTNLNRDGIEQSVKAAMGLSMVLQTDLHSATLMVVKADEGLYTALRRVGIIIDSNLTPEQKHQEMMKRLLEYYPQVTAQADTFGGKLQQLKNWWETLIGEVAQAITKNEEVRKIMDDLKGAIVDFVQSGKLVEWVDAATKRINDFAIGLKQACDELQKIYDAMDKAGGVIQGGLETAYNSLKDPMGNFANEIEVQLTSLWKQHEALVLSGKDTTDVDMQITILSNTIKGHDVVLADNVSKTKSVANETGNLHPIVEKVKTKVKEASDETKEWTKALAELNKELEHEISTLPGVAENINTVDLAMGLFKEAAKEDSKDVTDLGDDVAANTTAMGKDWETYINGPVAKATRAHESMRDSWASIWKDMVKSAGKAIGDIGVLLVESTGIFDFLKTPAKTFDDTPYTKEQAAIKQTYTDKKTALDKTTQDTINNLDTQQSAEESAIQNSDRSEADKAAMLQSLDIKYQTARQAALDTASANQAKADAQEVIDNQASLDKQAAAKDKAAADELARQNSLWTKVKGILGTAADDMLKILMSKLFDKWFDALLDIGPKTAKAVADTGSSIAGVSSAATGAISGMWTALGSAVGSFLGTLLGNLLSGGPSGHQQQQSINDTKDSRNFLADIHNWLFSAGDGFGGAIWDYAVKFMLDKFDGLKGSVDDTRTALGGYLMDIVTNTAGLKNLQAGASGLDMTVSRPTLFLAGERGAEHVNITNNYGSGPGAAASAQPRGDTYHITIQALDAQSFETFLREKSSSIYKMSKAGWLRISKNAYAET